MTDTDTSVEAVADAVSDLRRRVGNRHIRIVGADLIEALAAKNAELEAERDHVLGEANRKALRCAALQADLMGAEARVRELGADLARLNFFAGELCEAVEASAHDIGGARSTDEILRDLGRFSDEVEDTLAKQPDWMPVRCKDRSSCARHGRCMYLGCAALNPEAKL